MFKKILVGQLCVDIIKKFSTLIDKQPMKDINFIIFYLLILIVNIITYLFRGRDQEPTKRTPSLRDIFLLSNDFGKIHSLARSVGMTIGVPV